MNGTSGRHVLGQRGPDAHWVEEIPVGALRISDFLAEEPTLPSVTPERVQRLAVPRPELGDDLDSVKRSGAPSIDAIVTTPQLRVATSGERARVTRAARGLPEDPWLSRVLPGGYRLEALIDIGAETRRYRASRQGHPERPALVTLLFYPALREPAARRRFRDTARLASGLRHPNVLGVYGFGRSDDGVCFLATELVEGVTLRRLLDQAVPLPPGRALRIFAQVTAGLAAAHAQGLGHGDLRPDNILLTEASGGKDRAHVADLGGTAACMRPESDLTATLRSDVHALGRLLYELCCGQPPMLGVRGQTPLPMERVAPERRFAPRLAALVGELLLDQPAIIDAGEVLARFHEVAAAEPSPLIEDIAAPAPWGSGRLPAPGDGAAPLGRSWPARELWRLAVGAIALGLLLGGAARMLRRSGEDAVRPAPPVRQELYVPPPAERPLIEPAPAGEVP